MAKSVCIQAASYLGHKKVEQVVTKWLYCVVLSMLAGEDSFIFGVIKDVKAAVDELKKSEKQWKKVLSRQARVNCILSE